MIILTNDQIRNTISDYLEEKGVGHDIETLYIDETESVEIWTDLLVYPNLWNRVVKPGLEEIAKRNKLDFDATIIRKEGRRIQIRVCFSY